MGSPQASIYKVPGTLRKANPGAYTPQIVTIGPLHRSSKPMPDSSKEGDKAESSKMPMYIKKKKGKKYQNMESEKPEYVKSFSDRFNVDIRVDIIKEMKNIIKAEEKSIRASYAEKNVIDEMEPNFFVDLIHQDSIFIMEFFVKLHESGGTSDSPIVTDPIDTAKVISDLMLLENQLPYFILEKLFSPHLKTLGIIYETTLDQFILRLLSLETKVKRSGNFKHFTDMYRCAYLESLDKTPSLNDLSGPAIVNIQNADNLSRVGVKFKAYNNLLNSSQHNGSGHQYQQPLDLSLPISGKEDDEYSLHVAFKKSCLMMSSFHASEASERILRNVIAYEHCHVTLTPFTSNYIHFLNFLITSVRDVEVLTDEGVLTNGMGRPSLVVKMVNSLKVGLTPAASQYYGIAMNLNVRYKSRRQMFWATLRNVYFKDLFTGTATLAAVLLLFLTLVGTVASVIQAYKA